MRLEELYLDGFGHFYQRTIGPLSGPVTVFFGPNEAGKSTLLAFIRSVLFGFPRAYNSHYPPQAGGRHGGRAALSDESGARYLVERYAGSRGGLSVETAEGPASNADALMQRLTGNATPDLFRNVFAFSLDELQAASSLNDSSGTIYSAGQGAPGLPGLSRSLSDQKGKIYLPRGNNQRVPTLLNELRRTDDQLRVINGNAGRYGALTGRKSAIDTELQQADGASADLSARQTRVSRLQESWEDWVALSSCEMQLRVAPKYVDFPDNPLPRLEGLESQVRQLTEDWEEVSLQLRRSEESAAAAILDEDLLYDKDRIETIRRARGGFDDSVKDLPERRTELGTLESELLDQLQDLGQDWDEEKLKAFDTSIKFRQEVEQWKDSLEETLDTVRRAEQRMEQEQRTLADYQTAASEAEELLPSRPSMDRDALDRRRNALRAARARLGEYERAWQNHENLSGQLNSLTAGQDSGTDSPLRSLLLPVLMAIAGVALVVAGIVAGNSGMVVGIVGGLALMTAAAILYLGRKTTPVENPLTAALGGQADSALRRAAEARAALVEAAQSLALENEPTADALDSTEARLDATQRALTAWAEGRARVDEANRRVKTQEQRVKSASDSVEEANGAAYRARREWQVWLGEHGLPVAFTPDTVVEFMGRVDSARIKQEQVRENRQRVSAIEVDIEEFKVQVDPLAQRHGLPLEPCNSNELASVADDLIRRMDDAQKAYYDRERARELTEELREALNSRTRRLESAEGELAALLSAGGTDDAEEFRRRARLHEERETLDRQHDEYLHSLERVSGPGVKFDAFRSELAAADPDQLSEELARLSETRTEIDAQRNALREERGGIDTELAQLTSEEESSALRVRRNMLMEQLQEHAREWSRLTIAEALLEKTRQKFEQERQPSVVQHAQEFLSRVTGQRYSRLFAPIGEQTITVVDSSGARKQPHELSRGTREQLYLALRFGLIREFGEHAEPLPVVVDEVLVNFDPERALLAAEAFAELAETNQVLVFTCHPSTADMFAEAAGAQVVDISGEPQAGF